MRELLCVCVCGPNIFFLNIKNLFLKFIFLKPREINLHPTNIRTNVIIIYTPVQCSTVIIISD